MRLVLIGLLAGFFSALFGVGGGTIIVPLLLLVCSWEARSATATSLASIGITAVSGVIAYAIYGDVRAEYAGDLAPGHYRALMTYQFAATSVTSAAEFDVR